MGDAGVTERRKNLLLAVVATLLSYLFLEFVVWRPNLQMVPLAQRQQLGFLDILAQPSKAATLPKPGYVAIVGDSYAEGLGDWLMEEIHNGNPDINAGDVLHRISGRDVLSFGSRGGQPAHTYSYELTAAIEGINRYAGLELPPAGDVLAYFYEGNDINDMMAPIRQSPPDWARGMDVSAPETARRWIEDSAENGRKRAHRRWHVFANAHLADTAGHLAKLAVKNQLRQSRRLFGAEDPMFAGGWIYQEDWSRYRQSPHMVLVGGRPQPYPAPTVEPFLFHDDWEIRTAGVYFTESLRHLRTVFPRARIWAVYIPSPINVYPPAQPTIPIMDRIRSGGTDMPGPVVNVPGEALAAVSNATCRAMQRAAEEAGAQFLDTRPGLRDAAARLGYLHGPNDPGHLNRRGYESLAALFDDALKSGRGEPCRDIRP